MKLTLNKTILRYAIFNILISSTLVFLIGYTARFREGVLHYLRLALYAPGFFILFLLIGPTKAMHFTTYKTFLVTSFIFYSTVIAFIQILIYKRRKSKKGK